MSKSKHAEAQMIAALKQAEAGRKVEDVARDYGVSKHTMYAWWSARQIVYQWECDKLLWKEP